MSRIERSQAMENKSTQASEECHYEVVGTLSYDHKAGRMFLDVESFRGPWLSTSSVRVQGRLYENLADRREAAKKTA